MRPLLDTYEYFQKQLEDFDELTATLSSQAEKQTTPQLEVQQTHARLSLKEKQLGDLADAMRKYSPTEALTKQYEAEARKAAEEARKYKEDVMKKMQAELERRKREQKEREEERKSKILNQLQ